MPTFASTAFLFVGLFFMLLGLYQVRRAREILKESQRLSDIAQKTFNEVRQIQQDVFEIQTRTYTIIDDCTKQMESDK